MKNNESRENNRNNILEKTIVGTIYKQMELVGIPTFSMLSDKSCIDEKKLNKIVNGKQHIYADDLYSIAKALNTSVDYLCSGKEADYKIDLRLNNLSQSDKNLILSILARLEKNTWFYRTLRVQYLFSKD